MNESEQMSIWFFYIPIILFMCACLYLGGFLINWALKSMRNNLLNIMNRLGVIAISLGLIVSAIVEFVCLIITHAQPSHYTIIIFPLSLMAGLVGIRTSLKSIRNKNIVYDYINALWFLSSIVVLIVGATGIAVIIDALVYRTPFK